MSNQDTANLAYVIKTLPDDVQLGMVLHAYYFLSCKKAIKGAFDLAVAATATAIFIENQNSRGNSPCLKLKFPNGAVFHEFNLPDPSESDLDLDWLQCELRRWRESFPSDCLNGNPKVQGAWLLTETRAYWEQACGRDDLSAQLTALDRNESLAEEPATKNTIRRPRA